MAQLLVLFLKKNFGTFGTLIFFGTFDRKSKLVPKDAPQKIDQVHEVIFKVRPCKRQKKA